MEQSLRLSEDKFSKTFHAGRDAIMITRVRDGRVTDVNEGSVALSGFTRDEALDSDTIALGLWVDPHDHERAISAVGAHGSVRDLEFDFRNKSGEVLHCLFAGAVIDVAMQDAYLRSDNDGRFVLANPSAARLYGFDAAAKMIGLRAEAFYPHPADRSALLERLRETSRIVDYAQAG